MAGVESQHDPLVNLRAYRQLAPWNLRDLAALTAAILDGAAVRPINAAAAAHPSERTIRFYVARHLVAAPEGRGTAATYSYRHLLQVLTIKLRQMEGITLSKIAEELAGTTGDVLERRVAAVLGPGLPAPSVLPLLAEDAQPRGRAGQVLRSRPLPADGAQPDEATPWHRFVVADGVELHVRGDHPLTASRERQHQASQAVRLALGRIMPPNESAATPPAASGTSNNHEARGYQ
jgi:DNA-binding transcriptional MerR regulator